MIFGKATGTYINKINMVKREKLATHSRTMADLSVWHLNNGLFTSPQHHKLIIAMVTTSSMAWSWFLYETSTRTRTYFREKCPLKWWYHVCLNVEKIWNSAQINLSSTLNFYPKYLFVAIISKKSAREKDADLAQNEMQLYLIPSRHSNLSYANEYTCHRVMLSNETQITCMLNFHPHFCETEILSNFYNIHNDKCSFFVV